MKIREEIGRIGLKLIFYPKFNFKFTYENVDPKRKEPYFLVSNHASLYDPLYVGMNLKHYPYPIAANLLYTQPVMRFALTKIVTSIPKRKGQGDVQTIRSILKAFKEDRRGIMIFPEGNSSYFGEQTKTDFLPTAKLIKKVAEDVIYAKIDGGFLASPRWGKRRKKGTYQISYQLLIGKKDLADMDVLAIEKILQETIVFNDYNWNRREKIIYRSNQKAEGLERYLYRCPSCDGIQTLRTVHNDIYCESCGKIAHINAYEFIEGPPFDNLVAWGHFQEEAIPKIIEQKIQSEGNLFNVDFKRNKRIKLGYAKATLWNRMLELKSDRFEVVIPVESIEGVALTQRNFISFDYQLKTYMIKLEHCKLFLDAINYIKGEN